ncbi:MAG: uroporphyrinogen-III synthase [Alicyclobacillus sp.]|nr:uroporphyrinogen-III synthase [Alicyclobacillus sp.]
MDLSGVTVLLTRTHRDNAALAQRLATLGAEVLESPLLEFQFRTPEELRGPLGRLPDAAAAVVTSARAFTAVSRALQAGVPVPPIRCFTVGTASARAGRQLGWPVEVPPGVQSGRQLAEWLRTEAVSHPDGRLARQGVVWLRAARPEAKTAAALAAPGAPPVTHVVCYDTVPRSVDPLVWQQLAQRRRPVVVLYSPSAVNALVDSPAFAESRARVRFVAVGPTTAAALAAEGYRARTATDPSAEAVEDAVCDVATDVYGEREMGYER